MILASKLSNRSHESGWLVTHSRTIITLSYEPLKKKRRTTKAITATLTLSSSLCLCQPHRASVMSLMLPLAACLAPEPKMTAYCAALLAGITTALLSLLKFPEQRHYCARVSKLGILHEHTSQFTYLTPFYMHSFSCKR